MSSPRSKIDRLLARFAFSFVAIAAVLAWRGYQHGKANGQHSLTSIGLYAGAVACVGLAGEGRRRRERLLRESSGPAELGRKP
jgi:hypothetical protein